MPLGIFGNKFSPKKTPPRRAQSLSNLNLDAEQSRAEFGVDGYNGVKLNLGGQEVAFEDGMWVAESGAGGGSQREMMRLKKTNLQMHEENNLLKLKVDILLDILAETFAVSQFHENEVKQLRESKGKRK
ncbi:protein chibby homolog 1-like [Littorina saxatilis]|uniref:Chibby n=1 Tax=Littorina saxatilis TaxID=31220 RepID=A0AAN9BXL2_9CAEN|eukprot:GHVL01025040.1.p2 GENE.GHVL01025040.1~~GHVL01025040.1.p2  ORF type:complete len:129 (+),score=14.89 GHVL01025040.1:77-463(+)